MGRSTRRRVAPDSGSAACAPAPADDRRREDASSASGTVTRRYLDLLAEEGYRPSVVSHAGEPTVLSFKAEGEAFLLLVDDADPGFFHLGSAFELGETDLTLATSRANELNEELKGVKVTVWAQDRSVRFHVECFVDDAPASIGVLERSIAAIQLASRKFLEPARPREHLDA